MKPNQTEISVLPPLRGSGPVDGPLTLERRARLAAPFLPWPRAHLVDYGCGHGNQTFLFAEKFDQVTGVDTSAAQLVEFTAGIQARGLTDRFTAVNTDGDAIPLPDACADCVTAINVLGFVPDEKAVLAEMRRILRPDGRLLLSVFNRWWPRGRADQGRLYRKRTIRQLLTEAGFTVETTFNMTAPLDGMSPGPLQSVARATLFRADRTSFPFLATEIMVAATR